MFTGLLLGLFVGLLVAITIWWRVTKPVARARNLRYARKVAKINAMGFIPLAEVQSAMALAVKSSLLAAVDLVSELHSLRPDATVAYRNNGALSEIGYQTRMGFESVYIVDIAHEEIRDVNGHAVAVYYTTGWERVAAPKKVKKVAVATKTQPKRAPKAHDNGRKMVNVAGMRMTQAEYDAARAMGYVD